MATLFCTRCGAEVSAAAQFCANCGSPVTGSSASYFPPATPQPYAAGSSYAATATAYAPAARYGGFWMRFLAVLIDGLIVQCVVLPISLFAGFGIGLAGAVVRMPDRGVSAVGIMSGMMLGLLAGWLYEALMTSSARQATLGKMALRLRVTDLEGRRISFGRATGRHFAKFISSFTLLIGYIMAAFTERKQALHDLIAGTLVLAD